MKKIHWEPVVFATILAIMGFISNSDSRLDMTEIIYLAVASVAFVIEPVTGYNIIFGRYGVTSWENKLSAFWSETARMHGVQANQTRISHARRTLTRSQRSV